jgi:hypothetical protein
MTPVSALQKIPGGQALCDWFGRVPHYHDAEVLEISLSINRPSMLRIHTWEMTDKTDAKGYFILQKQIVVTVTLEDVSVVALHDFHLEGIFGFLEITEVEDGYRFTWDGSYGVSGSIQAKRARFDLKPGKP